MSATIRDMLQHNRFEIGGRVFRNYFVARAWERHIGKPEGQYDATRFDLLVWIGVRDTLCYGAGAVGMDILGMARRGSCQYYPHDVPDIQAPWHNGTPDQDAHVVAVVSGYDWGSDVRGHPIIRVGMGRRRQVVHFRLIMQA